jgi:uncharacterized protein YxeA
MKKLPVLLLVLCLSIVAYGQTNDEAKDRELSNIHERLSQIEKDMDSFKLSKELFGYTLTIYTTNSRGHSTCINQSCRNFILQNGKENG